MASDAPTATALTRTEKPTTPTTRSRTMWVLSRAVRRTNGRTAPENRGRAPCVRVSGEVDVSIGTFRSEEWCSDEVAAAQAPVGRREAGAGPGQQDREGD